MAVKFISVKCPECGSALDVEEGKKQIFCSFCGTKVMIQNENEYVYRKIDEAEIKAKEAEMKATEAKYLYKLKQLELEEKSRETKKMLLFVLIGICVVLAAVGIIGICIGNDNLEMILMVPLIIVFFVFMGFLVKTLGVSAKSNENDDDDEEEDDDKDKDEEDAPRSNVQRVKKKKVTVTFPMIDYEGKNYMIVESLYRKAGFQNIEMVPLNDLNSLTIRKNGMVAQITIDGDEELEEDSKYSENARVIITYHSR
ncbi:MAG: hypothetical protein MJ070_06615 [Lachnospiraceae bacterium]|nr:hypothetical protein [Lachnospiraceae bacterium]